MLLTAQICFHPSNQIRFPGYLCTRVGPGARQSPGREEPIDRGQHPPGGSDLRPLMVVILRKAIMHAKVSPLLHPLDDGGRESTRPIRALNRGLEVLAELNRLERAAINTLASAVGLPRTTTYRILETLRLAGYVDRDAHDDCYRPTIIVRAQ